MYGVRAFSSSLSGSSDDGGDTETDEEGDSDFDEDGSGEEEDEGALGLEGVAHSHLQAVTTISVPEIFPEVPVIPISRNPIFPKFVKMLEVCGMAGHRRSS